MGRKSIDVKYVKRLKQGDPEAFDEIFRFYKDSIYYFSLTFLKNQADAEEIVQETFITALKNIDSLQKPASFHSWLHKIAYNKSMTLYKKNSKNVQLDSDFDLENMIEAEEGPAGMLSRNELIKTIREEIENMPEALVQVAQLRYFDDLTTREIAEIMDIPEGTVKTRLNKVRKVIQPNLETRGFSPAKYFSFAFTPMMFSAFQQIIESNALSSSTTDEIFTNVSAAVGGIAGVLAGSAAVGGAASAASNASNSLLTAAKVATVAVAGGSGIYGAYNVAQSVEPTVEQIAYYNQITNKDVEVEVTLDKSEQKENVKVLHNGSDVAFTLTDNILSFIAVANGDYVVEVGGTQNIFTISNIDKQSPELLSVDKAGSEVTFSYADDISGIDFEKSYIVTNKGVKISLPSNNMISGDYSGNIKVYLYDKAGNEAEYEVDLDA